MTGDWTRDDALVYFTADEWDEITSALRNRAPISPSSSVNPHSDGGKPTPKPGKDLPAGGAAPLPEDGPGGTRAAEQRNRVSPGASQVMYGCCEHCWDGPCSFDDGCVHGVACPWGCAVEVCS